MENVKRVPVVLQMEAVECGAASLAMILAYYKRFIPLEKMRIDCNVTRDGSLAKYIVKAAAKHELETKAYKMDPEQIRQRQDFPILSLKTPSSRTSSPMTTRCCQRNCRMQTEARN